MTCDAVLTWDEEDHRRMTTTTDTIVSSFRHPSRPHPEDSILSELIHVTLQKESKVNDGDDSGNDGGNGDDGEKEHSDDDSDNGNGNRDDDSDNDGDDGDNNGNDNGNGDDGDDNGNRDDYDNDDSTKRWRFRMISPTLEMNYACMLSLNTEEELVRTMYFSVDRWLAIQCTIRSTIATSKERSTITIPPTWIVTLTWIVVVPAELKSGPVVTWKRHAWGDQWTYHETQELTEYVEEALPRFR